MTVGDDNETAELPPDQTADINENRSEEDEDDLSGSLLGLQSDGSILRQVVFENYRFHLSRTPIGDLS